MEKTIVWSKALFKCVETPLTFVLFDVSWRYERTEKTGMRININAGKCPLISL